VRRIEPCPERRGTKATARKVLRPSMGSVLPSGKGDLTTGVARPALANHLVQMARNGIDDEDSLAASGVVQLIGLTSGLASNSR